MTAQWRSFGSVALFDAWHNGFKTSKGYPLAGRNAKTGQVQPLSIGPTTEYTTPYTETVLDVRALVDDKDTALPGVPSTPPTVLTQSAQAGEASVK